MKSSRFVENCSSDPIQAVPLRVLPTLQPITTVTIVPSQRLTAPIGTFSSLATQTSPTNEPAVSVEKRGTVLFDNPFSETAPCFTAINTTSYQQNPLSINASPFMPTLGQAALVARASLTVQDLAQLKRASKKHHRPEWKLSQ